MISFMKNIFKFIYANIKIKNISWSYIGIISTSSSLHKKSRIYSPSSIKNSKVDLGTYISQNSRIVNTKIGKFCSIGPNFLCGWGIHPSFSISTSPVFYSTSKQVGFTLSKNDKFKEHEEIIIGNDVFIGSNVTVLDGVIIGSGAIIAAGSVVTKNVEPYAIIGGVPAKLIKYRFTDDIIQKLLKINWWDWPEDIIGEVETYFFDVENFVNKYYK